jgi:hypothetical protein
MADQLVRTGSAKEAIRDWKKRNHKKHWESVTVLKLARELIQGHSAKRTKDLLKLNRDQLRWVGLTDDPTCEMFNIFHCPSATFLILATLT